ncbi:MAG: hypothetical protein O2975_01655 [Proteobacteria bacterium]|nr:hypothetical protein [Pseudomonadota bacterium]
MSCRINYVVRDGLLRAVVSGHATWRDAMWLAKDIVEQAAKQASRHILIDVRHFADRLGMLDVIATVNGDRSLARGCKVAVLDTQENDHHYARPEAEARRRGYLLRCFSSEPEAATWLRYGWN